MQCVSKLLADLKVYTATRSYKELDAMDVTVHAQDEIGKHFAPTWRMVNLYHERRWDEIEFREAYVSLIKTRLAEDAGPLYHLAGLAQVTLTCFCGVGEFCHRYLLADILRLFGAQYEGER